MVLLGVLILVAVAVAVLSALLRGGDSVRVDLEWFSIDTNAAVVFFAGAVAMVLTLLGLWLIARGLKRSRRRRSEIKGLRKRAETSEEAAKREHDARTAGAGNSPDERGNRGPDDHFDSAPRDR